MGVMKDAKLGLRYVKSVFANRRAQSELRQKLALKPPLEPYRFKVAVYFADGKVNLYQMRQWYKPLAELSKTWPVLILSRASGSASILLDEAPVPVAYVRKVVDLERVIDEQDLHVIFYVNQNAKNFQMMRYGRRWHVFINHGESDKMYMTTNQFKAYDYALVAGDAALSRLNKVLWDYDFAKRALPIGRPQADHYSGDLPYTPDAREVVLYAPTWEGDRAAAAYGSVATHGVALVRALLASGRHRVIYRPHPRSGVVDDAYGAANREIIRMIAQANAADPTAQHIFDQGADLGWQLAAADVAVVDISAMVYDRLATGKPLMITRPVNPAAEIDTGGYLSDCEWLTAADAPGIVAFVDELSHGDDARERLRVWVERYFGDATPGAATARFHAAVQHLMDEWERNAALHAADGEVDEHDVGEDDDPGILGQ
ncbi:CDP-glycerol glycerophosphotransferase family protein [Leifsonia flava]|nr:CDP-glycerol glycerophosphotransferase family protein [Leifsonia flava]